VSPFCHNFGNVARDPSFADSELSGARPSARKLVTAYQHFRNIFSVE
jgi:hypothetical protein